ncbi:DUF2252 domain-containing protein [Gordonia desulfuricans]|uniref:DUF2252 domain-containing protein n=1 Tax=Gordonia desulfuricans TaxID=89051 RepID=A0A7K3LJ49_9ACTN|nr:DUF2252 domain-containing protein [Gordonia desulfuricans]NDK88081.1 DUF2252 domain-containing protein [Gordonia desulfuricans]
MTITDPLVPPPPTYGEALAAGPTEYPDEERSAGRAARKIVPRSALGDWNPDARGHDALQTILAQNDIRDERLLPIRHGRMSASPWTYYRGAAAVMAADLASRPNTGITVQMCGDAHVLNFGLWNTPERTLAFDLRDFDETLPGPFEWDLLRFLASLVVLARDNGVDAATATDAVRAGFRGYRTWIRTYADWPILDVWGEKIAVDELVTYLSTPDNEDRIDTYLEKRAKKRTSRGASKKLTHLVDGRRQIIEAPPYRVHALSDYGELLDDVIVAYYSSVPENVAALLRRFDLVDAVQQVVGVGSVGMRVFLNLVEEHATGDPLFFQVKQAGPSVYEQFLAPSGYENHGQRVVNGQQLIQSASDRFLGWTRIGDLDFYVRQFRDGKLIPNGPLVSGILAQFATACGHVLARAHARSGDARAIADYLGKSVKAEESVVGFAHAYADQTERDHAQLAAAVADGSIPSAPGWP